jgi:hypothetical protein
VAGFIVVFEKVETFKTLSAEEAQMGFARAGAETVFTQTNVVDTASVAVFIASDVLVGTARFKF